jgi:D-tyrosyl-tRNA(Tyr) deacylase
VSEAEVRVAGVVAGRIGRGLLVLLGVAEGDGEAQAVRLAEKVAGLRIFEDDAGKMNLSVADVGGAVLCVSQFTLYGDVRRGRRPSFERAAQPSIARALYERFCEAIARSGLACERGVFGEHMDVRLTNDGPVTLIIDTEDLEAPRRA